MSGHQKQSSDMGAAFVGLIGGAVFIGVVMYGIVLWTNAQFAGHKAEKATSAISVSAPAVS